MRRHDGDALLLLPRGVTLAALPEVVHYPLCQRRERATCTAKGRWDAHERKGRVKTIICCREGRRRWAKGIELETGYAAHSSALYLIATAHLINFYFLRG